MTAVSWTITAITIVLIVSFCVALVSLRQTPLAHRPRTPIYDRLGHPIGLTENPDYHENPGEEGRDSPDQLPT